MKRKTVAAVLVVTILTICLGGCSMETVATSSDVAKQQEVQKIVADNQATPTDINYSLERYNLIKRAYWVNGQREKANTLPCAVERPLGYIILFTESGSIIGSFTVDGKVSSLNSFLTPDSEYYEVSACGEYSSSTVYNDWLADIDGSYGENDNGIFFFTTDGKYIEWTGTYLYSDIPFMVDEPLLKVGVENE